MEKPVLYLTCCATWGETLHSLKEAINIGDVYQIASVLNSMSPPPNLEQFGNALRDGVNASASQAAAALHSVGKVTEDIVRSLGLPQTYTWPQVGGALQSIGVPQSTAVQVVTNVLSGFGLTGGELTAAIAALQSGYV